MCWWLVYRNPSLLGISSQSLAAEWPSPLSSYTHTHTDRQTHKYTLTHTHILHTWTWNDTDKNQICQIPWILQTYPDVLFCFLSRWCPPYHQQTRNDFALHASRHVTLAPTVYSSTMQVKQTQVVCLTTIQYNATQFAMRWYIALRNMKQHQDNKHCSALVVGISKGGLYYWECSLVAIRKVDCIIKSAVWWPQGRSAVHFLRW